MSMLAALMTFIALGLMRNNSWLAVLAAPAAIYLWIAASRFEWERGWLNNPVILMGAVLLAGLTLQTSWVVITGWL